VRNSGAIALLALFAAAMAIICAAGRADIDCGCRQLFRGRR